MRNLVIGIFLLSSLAVNAQLHLPKGNVLHLTTGIETLYEQTAIAFTTGSYKITDYTWEKVKDSLDNRWFVSACMNGQCRDGLPDTGTFIVGWGPDTTGFIMFHVSSSYYNGTSMIQYRVTNTKDSADQTLLTYYITYDQKLDVTVLNPVDVNMYPNPATNTITISAINPAEIKILNIQGRELISMPAEGTTTVDISTLPAGIYFVNVFFKSGDCAVQKLTVVN